MSPFFTLLELRVVEVEVTTGAAGHANLQSKCHQQQTKLSFLHARCPSCGQTNSVRALKGKWQEFEFEYKTNSVRGPGGVALCWCINANHLTTSFVTAMTRVCWFAVPGQCDVTDLLVASSIQVSVTSNYSDLWPSHAQATVISWFLSLNCWCFYCWL